MSGRRIEWSSVEGGRVVRRVRSVWVVWVISGVPGGERGGVLVLVVCGLRGLWVCGEEGGRRRKGKEEEKEEGRRKGGEDTYQEANHSRQCASTTKPSLSISEG